ncbi:MAG: methylated-DNA--[protein]-cysteine S-methyltransferase [Verrucomicrobia bacterium]|nr:methylated-DNA--[protein]-cysteine S-methyltransferase [Cytophagales bacterium]
MIYTTLYRSPLGMIEISGTDEAITSLMFYEAQKKPSPQLPESEQVSEAIQKCILQLDEYFEGKRQIFDLPLQQEGTFFQHKVWHELLNIPFGKTWSYLQLSKTLGDEKSIRAVASANGENKLSIIVPCHRIIGSDGSLTGYVGDLWRKQWLIEHEQLHTTGKWTLF